jgi:hypothetical protein
MRVRVLVAGAYNGPDHRHPVRAQPGDVIEVAGGWYAAELMAQGLVADVAAAGPPAPDVTGGPTANRAAEGAAQKKPFEPRGRKLSEIQRLKDLKE